MSTSLFNGHDICLWPTLPKALLILFTEEHKGMYLLVKPNFNTELDCEKQD